jgi:hypothetical protein
MASRLEGLATSSLELAWVDLGTPAVSIDLLSFNYAEADSKLL